MVYNQLNVNCKLLTFNSFLLNNLFSTIQSLADVICDIILAKNIVETSLFQLGVYLLANTGEYNLNVLLLAHLAEVGEVVDTG